MFATNGNGDLGAMCRIVQWTGLNDYPEDYCKTHQCQLPCPTSSALDFALDFALHGVQLPK